MTFKGEEILPLIQQLAESAKYYKSEEESLKQATFRTIVSRAYYSAFLEARSHVGLENDDGGSIHGKVQDAVFKLDRSLANSLSALKGDRTRADYRMRVGFTIQKAKNSLRQAKRVIEGLKKLK